MIKNTYYVKKKSRKPFKSGNKVNTIKGVVINPYTGKAAFIFLEDDSMVNMYQCQIIIPEIPDRFMNQHMEQEKCEIYMGNIDLENCGYIHNWKSSRVGVLSVDRNGKSLSSENLAPWFIKWDEYVIHMIMAGYDPIEVHLNAISE